MSALPPPYIEGQTFDASTWNSVIGARDGHVTPIDPITTNEIDSTYNLGMPSTRWRDVFLSGAMRVEGQSRIRCRPINSSFGATTQPILWNAPITNIGSSVLAHDNEHFLINKGGIYLVSSNFICTSLGQNLKLNVNLERPFGTTIDTWRSGTANSPLQKTQVISEVKIATIIRAQSGDYISLSFASAGSVGVDTSHSDVSILRIR